MKPWSSCNSYLPSLKFLDLFIVLVLD